MHKKQSNVFVLPALHYVWRVMHYIFFTCNAKYAKYAALYIPSITLKRIIHCNALSLHLAISQA